MSSGLEDVVDEAGDLQEEEPNPAPAKPKTRKKAALIYENNDKTRQNVQTQAFNQLQRAVTTLRVRCNTAVAVIVVSSENDIFTFGTSDTSGLWESSTTGFQDAVLGHIQASRGSVRVLQATGVLDKVSFSELQGLSRRLLLEIGMDLAIPKRSQLLPYQGTEADTVQEAHPWYPPIPYQPPAELNATQQQQLFEALCKQLVPADYRRALDLNSNWGGLPHAVKAKAAITNQCKGSSAAEPGPAAVGRAQAPAQSNEGDACSWFGVKFLCMPHNGSRVQ